MLSDSLLERYNRQIIMDEIGEEGQKILFSSKVLVVGAGGLGSPALLYLAAAGIGHIGIVDSDVVSVSNLSRQILHKTADVDMSKVESASNSLLALNPDLKHTSYNTRLNENNAEYIISEYDIVVDCVDNIDTRYIVNDTCISLRKPFVEAGVMAWDGFVMSIIPGVTPCYRCLYPKLIETAKKDIPVLGVTPGVAGCIQAGEAIKLLLGISNGMQGMLLFSLLNTSFEFVEIKRSPNCPACSGI